MSYACHCILYENPGPKPVLFIGKEIMRCILKVKFDASICNSNFELDLKFKRKLLLGKKTII